MKKIFKNEHGFTLIEMMIVLLVISVILLVALPNVTKHSSSINDKGCDALVQMVQGQVQAYHMEKKKYPSSLKELEGEYLNEEFDLTCPNGKVLEVDGNGIVSAAPKE